MNYKVLRCEGCNEFFITTADLNFQCPECNKQGRFFSWIGKDRVLKTIHFTFPSEYRAEKFLKYVKKLSPETLEASYWKLYDQHEKNRKKDINPINQTIKFKIKESTAVSPIFKIKTFWVRLTIIKIAGGFDLIIYVKDETRKVEHSPFITSCLAYIGSVFFPISNYNEVIKWGMIKNG